MSHQQIEIVQILGLPEKIELTEYNFETRTLNAGYVNPIRSVGNLQGIPQNDCSQTPAENTIDIVWYAPQIEMYKFQL